MRLLSRAVRANTHSAPSLPNLFPSLQRKQIAFRKGEVSVIAGQPGVGKSTLALAVVVRAQVPTVYFSADTHAHTMGLRLISMITGVDQVRAEDLMTRDRDWAADVLGQASHIRWSFDAAPSVRDIEDHILAHIELTSAPPECVVIDNLTDLAAGEGDEWGGMRSMMKDFKWISREYDLALIVLHHTSESIPGGPCPPRFALAGKVSQTPALVLTIAQDPDSPFLGVNAAKNRYGPSAPGGNDPVWLRYEPARMYVGDLDEEAARV